MWLYGSGFPKSMNIGLAIDKKNGVEGKIIGIGRSGNADTHTRTMNSKTQNGQDVFGGEYEIKEAQNEWAGWGTSLKPSYESVIVARKPFKTSVAENIMQYGVGGINIDECRVGTEERVQQQAGYIRRGRTDEEVFMGVDTNKPTESYGTVNGRFPANVILTYDETDFEEVCGGFPNTKSGIAVRHTSGGNTFGGNNKKPPMEDLGYNDSGSASRYFYCAKASRRDRDEGLDEFEEKRKAGYGYDCGYMNAGEGMFKDRQTLKKNTHPTVKPTSLMQYLVRLVTPKGGTILDPFMGSGSTGKAVMYENKDRQADYKFIGIELTEEYLPIAEARINYSIKVKETKQSDTAEQITFEEETNDKY